MIFPLWCRSGFTPDFFEDFPATDLLAAPFFLALPDEFFAVLALAGFLAAQASETNSESAAADARKLRRFK